MTVQELFEAEKITLEKLQEVADETDYWEKAINFVRSYWRAPVITLSQKQKNWITKIHEDLTERRIEGRL